MSVLTKLYTFVNNIVADASEVNRNFDDLFNEVNGGLNSGNLASTFSPAASQVTINDTGTQFTGTTVEAISLELLSFAKEAYRGYNSIQECGFHSQGYKIYAGRIEINGHFRYLSSDIGWTASDVLMITGSLDANKNLGSGGLWVLAVRDATSGNIANSDLGFAQYADTSASNGISVSSNGIYFSGSYTGSQTWRVIAIVANLSNSDAGIEGYASMKNLAPTGYFKELAFNTCEASGLGFTSLNISNSQWGAFSGVGSSVLVNSVRRIVDKDGYYVYDIFCKGPISATAGANATGVGRIWGAPNTGSDTMFYDGIFGAELYVVGSADSTFALGGTRAPVTYYNVNEAGSIITRASLGSGTAGVINIILNSDNLSYGYLLHYGYREL